MHILIDCIDSAGNIHILASGSFEFCDACRNEIITACKCPKEQEARRQRLGVEFLPDSDLKKYNLEDYQDDD